jgi:flagellar motor switch protein FliG
MSATAREEQVALLLRSLDPPAADRVLDQFEPKRKDRLRSLMQKQRDGVSPESLEQALSDLAETVLRRPGPVEPRPALRIAPETDADALAPDATSAAAPSNGDAAMNDSTPRLAIIDPGDPVAAVRAMELPRLIATLEGEHPQSIAVVLSCLDSTKAAEIMRSLPAELRRIVFLRLGHVAATPGDLEARIVQAVVEKSRTVADRSTTSREESKIQRMADVLKHLERTDRMELMAVLENQDNRTAESVRDRLYVFDDLRNIDGRSVQKILAEIDSKSLALALKGVAEELSQKIMANLSKRGREMVTEEISILGNVPPEQIQQARKAVVDVIQRLDQTGELVMNPPANENG